MEIKVQLTDSQVSLLEEISDITGVETGVQEENWIEVWCLIQTLDDLLSEYRDIEEENEDYAENYKPIGEDGGWCLARSYQRTLNLMKDYLEEKGLKEEFDNYKKSKKERERF